MCAISCIGAGIIIFVKTGSSTQTAVGTFFSVIGGGIQLSFSPYALGDANLLQASCLTQLSMNAFCGLLLMVGLDVSDDYNRGALGAFLVVTNSLLLFVVAPAVLLWRIDAVRRRVRRCFGFSSGMLSEEEEEGGRKSVVIAAVEMEALRDGHTAANGDANDDEDDPFHTNPILTSAATTTATAATAETAAAPNTLRAEVEVNERNIRVAEQHLLRLQRELSAQEQQQQQLSHSQEVTAEFGLANGVAGEGGEECGAANGVVCANPMLGVHQNGDVAGVGVGVGVRMSVSEREEPAYAPARQVSHFVDL